MFDNIKVVPSVRLVYAENGICQIHESGLLGTICEFRSTLFPRS